MILQFLLLVNWSFKHIYILYVIVFVMDSLKKKKNYLHKTEIGILPNSPNTTTLFQNSQKELYRQHTSAWK